MTSVDLGSVGNAACFAAGLALGCMAIASVLPLPDVPQVKEKLEWLRAHRGDYDVLFLGTSRVRRHVIPSLFDRLAEERGIAVRSFNLGVDSLASPEDGYVLDEALKLAPRLRYVFIELSYFRANFAGQGAETIRAAYWHDWERTAAVWHTLISDDLAQIKPLKKRKRARWSEWLAEVGEWAGLMARHGRLFLQRASSLGRGSAALQITFGVRAANDPLAPLGPAKDGFIPSDSTLAGSALAGYQQQLDALLDGPRRQIPLTRGPQSFLEGMIAKVRARGAKPILFIAPNTARPIFVPRRDAGSLFDFSDPHQWPELFDPRHRADPTHLNSTGAEAFTRALAGQFLSLADRR